MRSIGALALVAVIDEGTAEKIGGDEAHGPNVGSHVPVRGPDCETGRERAHLRFGRRTGRRVFEQARAMVPHHPRSEGRPELCSRADDNLLCRVSNPGPEELTATGFSGKGSALDDV